MSLREKIEDSPMVWLSGTLLAGFLAGIGAYDTVLRVAQLEVVSKARIEQLEETAAHAATEPTAKRISEAGESPSVPQGDTELEFSPKLPPFPVGFDSVKPGMRLSEARLALPHGELAAGWYRVDIATGPFLMVGFSFLPTGEDPAVSDVVFFFRDKEVKQAALPVVLREFGSVPHRSEVLGEKLVWPNVGGFQLVITDSSYAITSPGKP